MQTINVLRHIKMKHTFFGECLLLAENQILNSVQPRGNELLFCGGKMDRCLHHHPPHHQRLKNGLGCCLTDKTRIIEVRRFLPTFHYSSMDEDVVLLL